MLIMRAEIADELARLAFELARPMPSSALKDGWCAQTWQKWQSIFETLYARVIAGESDFSGGIARALDFDGVIGGQVLERAAAVGNALGRL